ncbi:MAG: hypothetical protein C5B51_19855 [Terriglobia bacterium]|nr:MAG: hypothetical protein C5B51_19855 [Terriglobia bacterium]
MKPLQIALLVVAGAVGGAIVMKVTQRPQTVAPAPVVAQAPTPATPEPQAQPIPQAPPIEPEAKPAPFPERTSTPKPKPVHRAPAPAKTSEPAVVAQNSSSISVTTTTPAPQPAPQPVPEPAPPAPREPENVTPPPPPPPRQVTLNAGMLLPVRLIDGLTSERNNPGDTFNGTLDQPLVIEGLVIAERGARVEGRVVSADRGGKVSGLAALSVELTRIHLSDGQTISVRTDSFQRQAEQTHKTDAAKIGGGAALGAIIGAIAGGGKGAAIGAAAGGGAGAGDVLLTRGKAATLPSETRINFRLSAPVTVTERRA